MDIDTRIDALDEEILALKRKRAELRRQRAPDVVDDYAFTSWSGATVRLSELFEGKDRLILVHNMGEDCNYCMMWADGLNGLRGHIESRAAFVVTNADTPDAQQEFARSRGWSFRMASVTDERFLVDMGFLTDDGYMPGVSVFARSPAGTLTRVAWAWFGPGDDFCATWHLFDLLPATDEEWHPRRSYG